MNAKTRIPPSGIAASAKFLIVGTQPELNDIRQGKPFASMAGQQLTDCLSAANIVRAECYLTNVITDLDHPISYYCRNRGEVSFTVEGQPYVEQLRQELSASPCKFIIAIGEVALKALTSRDNINKWRGSIVESTLLPGRWVLPILDPATIIPPKCQFLNRPLIVLDLKRFAEAQRSTFTPYPYEVTLRPSFEQSLDYLNHVRANVKLVAFDIEVVNEEVSCISFCHDDHRAISIAFVDSQGDIFSHEQEAEIWRLIGLILSDEAITKLGQNLVFDSNFLFRRYGICTTNIEDTMIAQQVIMTDYPKGLDFICSIHTDLPYYKDEGKKWFRLGGSWEQLWNYNGLDSLVCFIAYPKQLAELAKQGNLATYQRQRNIVLPLVYMMERGIKADIEGIAAARKRLISEADKCRAEIARLVGRPLNPNSSAQLITYFYDELRLPRYKSKTTRNTTADADALKRISRKNSTGSNVAKLILHYRKNLKIANTYLVPEKFDADGRIRCSYNPAGTRFSRISSSSNIFGSGMNLQNWPHAELKHLMADDGYVGYAFDLSQAENRIVAYLGCVEAMIEAFENEQDVHSLTAGLIFNKHPDEVTHEDGTCSLGDGTHSERFWGKKANHGLNYDLGYRTFAMYYEMSERDARFIVERYHLAYPGVRNLFHKNIRMMLQTKRIVTNLMGRNTLFLGRLDDATFKDAYSCVPQGTVGDIINERGLAYIYYNRKFREVELLTQTHDEITFQIPLSLPWERHAEMLLAIKRELEVPLEAHGREFVIPADLTVFKRFKSGVELKGSKFPRTNLAEVLQTTWGSLNV